MDRKNSEERGWGEIIDFYVDDGFSAKDTQRPAYQRMMNDVRRGKVNLILITDLSRLSRSVPDFGNLLVELDKMNAQFLSIRQQQYDTSTPMGKMMVYNSITLAQFEREQISERVTMGVHSRAMRGFMNGGRAILGFDKDPNRPGVYVVNDAEAIQVREIFNLFLSSGSRAKTIKELNARGLKPKAGLNAGKLRLLGKWNENTLGSLLTSAAYIGFHEVNRRNKNEDQESLKPIQRYQLVKASWPAIVDTKTFERAQLLLEDARKLERARLEGAVHRTYFLSGVLRCGQCGNPLAGRASHGTSGVHRYYGHTRAGEHCGCDIQRASAEMLENAVLNHFTSALKTAGYFGALEKRVEESSNVVSLDNARLGKQLRAQLKDVEGKSVALIETQLMQKMTDGAKKMILERLDALAAEKEAIAKRLESLSYEVEAIDTPTEATHFIETNLNEFVKGFRKATEAQKKRLIRRAIKEIVLSKEGLTIFFHLPSDANIQGHKLKLMRVEGPENEAFSLVKKASGSDSNLAVFSSRIRKNGDRGTT